MLALSHKAVLDRARPHSDHVVAVIGSGGRGLQVGPEGVQGQVLLAGLQVQVEQHPTSTQYGIVTTVATAATTPWTNQLVLPNGAVITALTMPVSRPATTRVPKACHQCPPTSPQERPMASVPRRPSTTSASMLTHSRIPM
jgi:hypothetical protein